MHFLFSAECTGYMSWQSYALYYTFRKTGVNGNFTRLLACDAYDQKNVVPTFVHRNFKNLEPGDDYPPYNKPGSILTWLDNNTDYDGAIFMHDADMLFVDLEPIRKLEQQLRPGIAFSARYDYLKGVDHTDIVERFLGSGIPAARIAKVGGWALLHSTDARCIAPKWLQFTRDVRTARDGSKFWPRMGDEYVTDANPRPWIAEMYGFVFAVAACDVEMRTDNTVMLYPSYEPQTEPAILHYGLRFGYDGWSFDKHDVKQDLLQCPVSLLTTPPIPTTAKDMYSSQVISLLNEALETYNLEHCVLKQPCDIWKRQGGCVNNTAFMLKTCSDICTRNISFPASKMPRKLIEFQTQDANAQQHIHTGAVLWLLIFLILWYVKRAFRRQKVSFKKI